MKPKPNRLTVEQAAEWLDTTKAILLAAVRAGKLRVIKVGNRYLITEQEVERYDREREAFTH